MGVQVRSLEARMATLLMSLLILTTINGGVMIFSAEAALDPLCGASHEWFCSPNDSSPPDVQVKIFEQLTPSMACVPIHSSSEDVIYAYVHSYCVDANDPKCDDCLKRATELIRYHCYGKDGAQYGTEQCCVRYEKEKFC
ncbi:unnamed protein product [Linum trigynum]|uniref:Gnk2-homologous domain-containing protein n=1 Tax=Linum trigynum TaxID=586398 RepID=A0AAV2CLB4_9ROSI